jgi:phage tail sheath protein FI
MAFQLSPGVNVSEVDLTTVVPSVATTVGGFAGNFNWGPVNEVVTINNEVQLVERFGKPDSNTYTSFFTVANFLSYSNDVRVVRSVGSSANNATVDGVGTRVLNRTDYDEQYPIYSDVNPGSYPKIFLSKYPGSLGNSITVSMCDANTTLISAWSYSNQFSSNANTSSFATSKGLSNDELHIVVVDRTGLISGTAGTILEKFGFVSKLRDAKNEDGTSNYYAEVINTKSKWVWWGSHPLSSSNWGAPLNFYTSTNNLVLDSLTSSTFDLSGGVDAAPTAGNINTSYDLFDNPDSVDVSLIMTGSVSGDTVPDHLISMAENRKDCLVFLSPEQTDVVNNSGNEVADITTLRNTLTSSSFAVMDSGWKYQYDKYNDVYRWIPLNGDVAGLCARTDVERDPWFSPAGFNRGQIKNVVKLSWNPTKAERDSLYNLGVNPVVTFPGEGTILYGDKTLLSRPSAFDRINVRRLFIVLEKSIARAARSSLFEFNDEFTRAQFVNLVEPFLRDVQGRRGIYDYRVVCDTTNNTPEVIDRNEFVGDIYIKPARSINFIQLNFVAVRTGVSFNEVVGSF